MSDEIIQLKPNFYGLGLDLKAAWKRISRSNREPSPTHEVAERFLQIFLDHGIAVTQIPRLLPSISFGSLISPDTLIAALNPGVLDEVARLFGIRSAWLEGVDGRIYETGFCYKSPQTLLDVLDSYQAEFSSLPVKALTSAERLDCKSPKHQNLLLVRPEKITELGEESIERFHIYGDLWDWSYRPCRLQLKAMARLIYQRFHKPIPIIRVDHEVLLEIGEGKRVPSAFVRNRILTEPSLEDFGLSAEESAVAQETDEFPEVMAYIQTIEIGSGYLPPE
mgnify:CR=1 FL=1